MMAWIQRGWRLDRTAVHSPWSDQTAMEVRSNGDGLDSEGMEVRSNGDAFSLVSEKQREQ